MRAKRFALVFYVDIVECVALLCCALYCMAVLCYVCVRSSEQLCCVICWSAMLSRRLCCALVCLAVLCCALLCAGVGIPNRKKLCGWPGERHHAGCTTYSKFMQFRCHFESILRFGMTFEPFWDLESASGLSKPSFSRILPPKGTLSGA